MTIHLHKNVTGVSAGGSAIAQADGIAELATDRTWAIEVPPEVEERILEDVELSARTAGAVPKTHDENIAEVAAQQRSSKDVQDMALALRDLVNERKSA